VESRLLSGTAVAGSDRCACGNWKVILNPPAPCYDCEAYATVRSGDPLDRDAFEDLLLRAGRNHAAGLLVEAYSQGTINEAVLTAFVGPAWCAVEFPDRALGWATWRRLFDIADYTVDGNPAPRPAKTLRLYRAATAACRAGHSWTENRSLAREFLTVGNRDRFNPVLWSAVVQPCRLLARLEGERPDERQYVVETAGLHIRKDFRVSDIAVSRAEGTDLALSAGAAGA
jgi:hypothetical protein